MRDRKYSFLARIGNINQKGVFFMSVLPKEVVQEVIKGNNSRIQVKFWLF